MVVYIYKFIYTGRSTFIGGDPEEWDLGGKEESGIKRDLVEEIPEGDSRRQNGGLNHQTANYSSDIFALKDINTYNKRRNNEVPITTNHRLDATREARELGPGRTRDTEGGVGE